MSDYDNSGQDALSSDSEESFENENELGSQLQDSRQQSRSIDGAASGTSLLEKEPVPADLEYLPLHKDSEKRQKQFCGAHVQGSFAVNQLRNTCLTSDGSVVLVGASYSLPGTSILEPSLGDAEHSTVESSDKSMERPAGERECLEAQWLCEHYQRHCSVKFPCCTQFYSCHHCHNISTTCDNEEAKACHATHLKCSYCQHEQEICEGGARCQKCSREMSAFFCSICKHFASLDENPYHCEECGICWIHKDKSFHRNVCNVCLDKRLGGNHKCRPDSSHDEFCICLEDAFIGCQILPCSHKGQRGSTNVAATQSGIEEDDHGLCLCERCTSSREDQGVSTENQHILHAPLQSLNSHSGLYSDEGCVEREDNPRNHLEDLLHNSRLQTISLDGSSLVEKMPIPAELENPGEALFLTDKEKRFMQSHGAHLQEACVLVERVLGEREEHEQFGGEIERKEQLTGEQRVGEGEEIKERELGCTQREGASVALTQNGIEYYNHGLCLCKRCTLSREDEEKEVSPALPMFADSSSSTQSQAATDDNCAQSQTSSTDAALETLSGLKISSMSANSQIAPEADSIYDKETQHILYAPFPEGIAPSFLARHTQDKDLYERALLEMSLPNDIPSHPTSSSNLSPVPDFVFGLQRANPYFGADDTNLWGSLESFLSMWSSGQRERQGMDEGSWAGAVRPRLGFPFHGPVGGAFNDPLTRRNAAFHEDCSTTVLEGEAGFGDDIFVQSPADGAIPQQAFTSANSRSRQFWNRTGARPRETQGRRFSVTTDWVSPVARAQQSIEDESLLFDGGREGTEEDFEDSITTACLLRHSQDEALCTWALHEHVLMVEEVEQLRRRIEWKEKVIKEKRACKEKEEEKELQEMTCNVQVHTAHKVPVQVCINCNEIIDAQHQESHPCHHHPDICCICHEYLDDFIGCTEVPCGHKFHEECYINMLLNNIETCPLCRRPF